MESIALCFALEAASQGQMKVLINNKIFFWAWNVVFDLKEDIMWMHNNYRFR